MKVCILLIISVTLTSVRLPAQSATTEALYKKHSESLTLFFYQNTLRMLNQAGDQEFDDLIKDIEKMRFLLIKKSESKFADADFKKLLSDYRAEQFEEIMTSRHEGKNFNVYLKERAGQTKGMLVLVQDTDNLYVLDILGRIALEKVTSFYDKLDNASDIRKRIGEFVGEEKEGRKPKEDSHR